MKVYTQTFDLAQPTPKAFSVAQYSDFGIGIKIVKNGVEVEDAFTLEKDGVTLTPEADKIAGYTVYLLTADGAANYTVTCNGQTFTLTQGVTDSTVIDYKPASEPAEKYGASLDIWLGDVDENGALQPPTVQSFEFESDEIRTLNIQGATPLNAFKSYVSSVNLTNLSSVGTYSMVNAFKGSTKLTRVNLPALTTLDEGGMLYAFQNCTNLLSVNLPALTTLGTQAMQDAFNGCTKLSSITMSGLSSVTGIQAMSNLCKGCTSLKSVVFDNLTTAAGMGNAFQNCTSLEYVSMPKLTNISVVNNSDNGWDSIFKGCTSLKVVDIPMWSQCAPIATMYMFSGCTSLQYVNISQATAIPNGTNAAYMFTNTNDTYKIIVPDALYENWIAANGWSTISSHIVKASEYPLIMTPYNGQDHMDEI